MTVAAPHDPFPPAWSGRPRSTGIVEFRETLVGAVKATDSAPTQGDDRFECALAVEGVSSDSGEGTIVGCVLEDLRIAVDVGTRTADHGWAGLIRSGRVHVEGLGPFDLRHGEFELFPMALGDARRMRYRLWLRDADGRAWYLRGTKLVVNEAPGGLLRRIWTETATLHVVLTPYGEAGDDRHLATSGEPTAYVGVVQVPIAGFARQLISLRGEPGPAGGMRAVRRLATAFLSVIIEVYLHGRSPYPSAPGIEAAFDEPDR